MKKTVMFGVLAALVGIGTASIMYANRIRRNAALEPEKSIDSLVDYCQTKVDQLDNLLKSLPSKPTSTNVRHAV